LCEPPLSIDPEELNSLGDTMDKDRVEGKLKDIKGRVKRQAGEWSGDEQAQAEGAMDQAEGKVQNAVGKTKDAVRDLNKKLEDDRDRAKDEDAA
jgi:uncharacterized protein YjbJ (UPF0337 family)